MHYGGGIEPGTKALHGQRMQKENARERKGESEGKEEREKPVEITVQWKPYVIYDRVRRARALS